MAVRIADTLGHLGVGGYPLVMSEDVQVSNTDTRTVKKAIEDLEGTYGSTTVAGIVKVNDDGLDVAADGEISLDIATDTSIGGIIVGDHLKVDATGKVDVKEEDIYLKEEVYTKKETEDKIAYAIGTFVTDTVPDRDMDESTVANETPVGTIISHMGKTAPNHYLICDGSEYNIEDYKELADFFKKEFGKVDYFGGDGEYTFKVPNLQGEFLRGTGINSHTNQGSGASVGVHQDATENLYLGVNQKNNGDMWFQGTSYTGDGTSAFTEKGDTYISKPNASGLGSYWKRSGTFTNATGQIFTTSRPTNTSVLYCIKYESTHYLAVNHLDSFISEYYDNYREEEVCIGRWINGKPLYRKVINMEPAITTGVTSVDISFDIPDIDHYMVESITFNNGVYKFPNYNTNTGLCVGGNFSVTPNTFIWTVKKGNAIPINNVELILRYTKAHDEVDSFTPQMIYDYYLLGSLDKEATREDLKDVFGQGD